MVYSFHFFKIGSEDGDGLDVEPEGGWVHLAAADMEKFEDTMPDS